MTGLVIKIAGSILKKIGQPESCSPRGQSCAQRASPQLIKY